MKEKKGISYFFNMCFIEGKANKEMEFFVVSFTSKRKSCALPSFHSFPFFLFSVPPCEVFILCFLETSC